MKLEDKIVQLYKTISQNLLSTDTLSYSSFIVNYPLYFLERIAIYLVQSNKVIDFFENSDFEKLALDREILTEIANSVDNDIEQLNKVELRNLCKELITSLLTNRSQWSSGWTKGRSNHYYNSLTPDYVLYDFVTKLLEPSANQIIYNPDCNLGSMFIRLNREFPDYNLRFIGQELSFSDDNFICKINLFANGLEKAATIYSENPLDISSHQTKIKADIAIATNYPHGALYPSDVNIDISQLESNEKIRSYEAAYIELMLSLTKDNGKVIVVVPDNFLVNKQSKYFRQKYLENDLIEKVISLPRNIFNIPNSLSASIIVLNKNKPANTKGFVIFDGEDEKFEETQVNIKFNQIKK